MKPTHEMGKDNRPEQKWILKDCGTWAMELSDAFLIQGEAAGINPCSVYYQKWL